MNVFSLHYLCIVLLIEDVTVTPKNLNLEIVLGEKNVDNNLVFRKDGMHHNIFRITLTSQDQYAVDLTGAQYGHHQDCVPWQDYVAARVDHIMEVNSFGATKRLLAETAFKPPHPRSLLKSLCTSFLGEMELCINLWESRGGSVNTMLALPEEQYFAKKVSFLEFIKTCMKRSREDSIKQGSWCRK